MSRNRAHDFSDRGARALYESAMIFSARADSIATDLLILGARQETLRQVAGDLEVRANAMEAAAKRAFEEQQAKATADPGAGS